MYRRTSIFTQFALLLALVVAPWPASRASAQTPAVTITVDTTLDASDFGGLQQVSDLPGPDGVVTFREAITAANNTGGPQTIAFAIPTTDPNFNTALGIFTITLDQGDLLVLTDDATTIDATTQAAATGDTNPHGGEVSFYTYAPYANLSGIRVYSNNNTFVGLLGFNTFRFGLELLGDNNVVKGCNLVQSLSASIRVEGANNRIGGTGPGEGNLIQSSGGNGVWIVGAGATGNVVQGNTVVSHHSNGIDVENASSNTIGGAVAGAGNVVHSNGHFSSSRSPVGANIAISGTNNVVQGNMVGVDATGTVDEGNIGSGVVVSGSGHVIGGLLSRTGNVISGHNYEGTRFAHRAAGLSVSGTNITVKGNWIGTDRTGTIPLPNTIGIRASGPNVLIGGQELFAPNTIALNRRDGITTPVIESDGVHISRNSIYGNGELGINRGYDPLSGVTYPNTVTLAGAPVIDHATFDGVGTNISGHLDGASPEAAIIEIFSSGDADASGYGEGQRFEADLRPGTNGQFFTRISSNLSTRWVTATATTPAGTSEFSDAEAVVGGVQAKVTVVFPHAGETWTTGTERNIQWTTFGSVDRVAIRVSYDGGAHFDALATDVANSGTFAWPVSGPETLAATVTVAAVADPSIRDASDEFRLATGPAGHASTPGVYLPSTGTFFLRDTASSGSAHAAFDYGPSGAGWLAITGDWDGDGSVTVGLYDPSSGVFFLKDQNSAGDASYVFGFGSAGAGWLPIAGDWDGDGRDTVGLYSLSTGVFFLRNVHAGGDADVVFQFGAGGAGFTPLAGDWNGDGVDSIGLYATASGTFFLRDAHAPGAADYVFAYGPANATAIVGDWDGNGTDTAGVYIRESGAWFLRNSNSGGVANTVFNYGPAGAVPVTGDWNGQ